MTQKETKAELKEELREEKNQEGQWNTIIVIVLAIALVLTFFQAVQISSVGATVAMHEEQIMSFSEGGLVTQSATNQTASTGSGGIPSSLQNIPDMVGGC